MQKEVIKKIIVDSSEDEFQIRFFKEEGIGLITSRNDKNYLILDSLDFWYDLTQTAYPKKKKCTCKNEFFKVEFQYIPREGTGDFRSVNIYTTCTNCSKYSKSMSVDLDYSPTIELLHKPVVFCQNPKIKYKYSELTSYWSIDDLQNFLGYIVNELHLNVYCWFFKYPDNKRCFDKVSFDKAKQIITINHRYLNFYFTSAELNIEKMIKISDDKGVYLEEDIWRKNEIIQLSAPFVISGYGSLYYINFCNQYLLKTEIRNKSKQFEEETTKLQNWLRTNLINKRGKNCFDGEEAYRKYLSKRMDKQ